VITATIGERNHPEQCLEIKNVLTIVDEVDEKHKRLRKDYDQLCELVHPNPESLYARESRTSEIYGNGQAF
jgi:hypothetical protein